MYQPHPFTQAEMKPVIHEDGSIDLLYRTPAGAIEVFCRVPPLAQDDDHREQLRRANLLSAAPLLLQAILDLIEYAQPEGWDSDDVTDESLPWRNAFVATAAATGSSIRWRWTATPPDPRVTYAAPGGPG